MLINAKDRMDGCRWMDKKKPLLVFLGIESLKPPTYERTYAFPAAYSPMPTDFNTIAMSKG